MPVNTFVHLTILLCLTGCVALALTGISSRVNKQIRTAICPAMAVHENKSLVMKKFFSLAAGMLLTAAVFAAGRGPTVTISSYSDYKIEVDGRSYFGNNISLSLDDYYNNSHTIRVYEMRRGFFGTREVLISSSNFRADRNDIAITIDRYGRIDVREVNNYYDRDRDDRRGRDRDDNCNDRGRDNDNRHDNGWHRGGRWGNNGGGNRRF